MFAPPFSCLLGYLVCRAIHLCQKFTAAIGSNQAEMCILVASVPNGTNDQHDLLLLFSSAGIGMQGGTSLGVWAHPHERRGAGFD